MSDNDIGQYREATPSPTNAELETPGKDGRNAFLGYKPLPKAEPTEETYGKGDDEIRRAARDHAAETGSEKPSEPAEPFLEVPSDGGKYALSVEEAAKLVSQEKKFNQTVADVLDTDDTQFTVDTARYLAQAIADGRVDFETARQIENEMHRERAQGFDASQPQQQQPQEAPQPESEPPPSGVDPEVHAALQNPKVRAAVEAVVAPAEQARRQYTNATAELAAVATALATAQFPELQQYNAHQLPAVLDYMAKQSPERYQEIMTHLSRAQAIVEADKRAQQQQATINQAHLARWSAREAEYFDKMIAHESPERRQAVRSEIDNFGKENGLSFDQLKTIFAQNPAMQSAAFQKLIWDGLAHRIARRNATADPASRSRIPVVQKPGIPRSRGDADAENIAAIRDQFRKASGNEQLKLAVKLHRAQRAARGD